MHLGELHHSPTPGIATKHNLFILMRSLQDNYLDLDAKQTLINANKRRTTPLDLKI